MGWLVKTFDLIPVKVWELLLLLVLVLCIFFNGKIQYWRGEHYILGQQKTAVKQFNVASSKVAKEVQTVYVDRIHTVQLAGKTIIKKVPIYVTRKDDSSCTINSGFVQLWNSANEMSVPISPSSAYEAPSSIVLSTVAIQHAREATAYQGLYEQVMSLQDWIRKEQALK